MAVERVPEHSRGAPFGGADAGGDGPNELGGGKNEEEMEFDFDSKDEVLEQLNVLAIKMDLHKNGILYLKESVLTTFLNV